MSKRLIPLLDRVLVEKIVAPTKSVGGILLPETAVSKARNVARRDRRSPPSSIDRALPAPASSRPDRRPPHPRRFLID
jgi:hypothetical protein